MTINNIKFKAIRYSSGELKLKKEYLNSFLINDSINIFYNYTEINLFELFILIKYYQALNINMNINLTLSYLPYQRMNKINSTEVETVRHVSEILNSLNLNNLYICEPHTELNYFNNSTKINVVEKLFKKIVSEIDFDIHNDIIVFTDNGSVEKYGHLGKNHILSEKQRDKETGLILYHKLSNIVPKNKKVIIIDDIISSGDTVYSVIQQIHKQHNNNNIYILSGHIEDNKYNKRITKSRLVKMVYSTNSLKKLSDKKLKLYDLRELINE